MSGADADRYYVRRSRKRIAAVLVICAALSQPAGPAVLASGNTCFVNGSCTFKSLTNSPIGQAQLILDPNAALLTVSNIGSSGGDGVLIRTPSAGGINIHTEDIIDLSSAPDGAFLKLEGRSVVAGVTSSLTYQVIGGQLQIIADFSPMGTTTRRVQAFCGGNQVASAVHSGPVDVESAASMAAGTYMTICHGNKGGTAPADGTVTYTNVCLPGGGGG